MEIEALRRQLSDEIAAQFEAKLREAKRQKSQIEEEFEQSAEKWRTERRRLNSEIDRLESALAEARQSGRDVADTRPELVIDPEEIAKLQAEADEKLKEASDAWEKERGRLQAEISRLQEGIAGLIERSNNPLRASAVDRGKSDSKYEDAMRAKRLAEEALFAAKSAWEAEKQALINEAEKARQATAAAGTPRKGDEQLDKKLKDSIRLQGELASDLEKARHELSSLKEAHAAELQSMMARLQTAKNEWEAEKASLVSEAARLQQDSTQIKTAAKEDAQLEKRLQEAIQTRDSLAADLEKTRQQLAQLKDAHAAELQKMSARLQAAKTEWEAEKANLAEEAAKLRQSAATAIASKKGDEQLHKRLQEAIQKRDGLTAELEKASQELSRLKAAHAAELQNMNAQLQAAKTAWEAEKASLAGEAAKLRQTAAAVSAPRKGDEQLDKRLQETIRTRDGLSADLEKSKHEIAKLKETHSAELKDFTTRYIQTRSNLEKQLQESEQIRGKLERELEKAQKAAAQAADTAQADGALSEELSRLKKALEDLQEEKKRLVLRLAETGDMVGADAVNELRQKFEGRIQEILQENTQLTEKLKNAAAQMDGRVVLAVADGSSPGGGSVATLDASEIDEEVKRVEDLTAEIAQLIDNPETELATVIRKNVERAALESYLKGILFSTGRGKKF